VRAGATADVAQFVAPLLRRPRKTSTPAAVEPWTPDRWSKVTGLFDAALDCPVEERSAWLERACQGDVVLQRQVAELLTQFEQAGTFMERPPFAPAAMLATGELIQSRYRVEALLGRGGMGEVYRARDELVGEHVALKTLRLDTGDYDTLLRQFRREVQLARKVTHPSVCRVFDVGVHTDGTRQSPFFTMQLLEGETLAARIRRAGPLPKEQALLFAMQMAAGLHAAHGVGIVHRDFKSANVMLCADRAVVMDFGLALAPRADSGASHASASLSAALQVAGTLAYMSPEQLSGGAITAASDIYSFGIVLFEMATGRLPFNDRHILRSAMQRAAAAVPDVRGMAPELDVQWASVIERCLQRDPGKRFTSFAQVAESLKPRWHPPLPRLTRRRWFALGGAAAVSAAGVALVPVALRFYRQDVTLPEGADVLLGPIDNLTGDERFDALTELFRNQLAQSARVNVIDGRRVAEVLSQMGLQDRPRIDPGSIREAAWRLNAMLAIYGTVARIGPDYVLNVQLETRGAQPDAPRAKSLHSFASADPGALMQSVRDASLWVRETIGESPARIATSDILPDDATTPSWRALACYARGQQRFMQQDFNGAIDQFTEALAEDPQFTLAALRRADLLVSQYRQTEGFVQYRNALALLGKRAVTRPEELYGRGMFAADSGDFEGADRYFRTWSAEYPFDWRAPFYRMYPLCMSGHAAQALELLNALRPTLPNYGDLYVQLCRVNLVLGQTAKARALLPDIRRLNRPERAALQEAFIRFREADCVGCLEMLRGLQQSRSYRRSAADAMSHEGLLLIDAGFHEAAAARIDAFLRSGSWIDARPQQIALRMIQSWAEMLSGQRDAAIAHASEALAAEAGPLIVALAGTVYARLGAVDEAQRAQALCNGLEDIPLYRTTQHRIAGELARHAGDLPRALVELRAAAALEPPIAQRQYLIEALPPGSAERLDLCVKAVRTPWGQHMRPPPMHHIGALGIAVPEVIAAGLNEPFAQRFAATSKELKAYL
jgi:eukaryotic-like serine/threonine-protein kinase